MLRANKETTNGYICGEVKLAITLRILSGGSYLDVSDIFKIEPKYCYPIFHSTLQNWICNNEALAIDINDYLNDEAAMIRNAKEFGQSSKGYLTNVIGALDGWLVKITCPKDKNNVGGYKCRKVSMRLMFR